jgi:hypothetical protein
MPKKVRSVWISWSCGIAERVKVGSIKKDLEGTIRDYHLVGLVEQKHIIASRK